ncbi:DUF3253 domain-containing protein [Acidovorax sp. Leaf160]|uniref:DUF3253 domain-containing protein n=1 Tax=Acidovorax sp. Leaf160 TaxID=1736280 RepID=UPI0009EAE00E|nr:DUF3253 domain-containing protein [Acidovorax sp. Leaf160]
MPDVRSAHAPAPPESLPQAAVEARIFSLLAARQPQATICPSEVARSLAAPGDRWRDWMPHIREVARNLALAGRLRVTRQGVPVDATAPGGPIRLGRVDE